MTTTAVIDAATPVVRALCDTIDPIVISGADTHGDVGNPVAAARIATVSIASGVVAYDPDDMTVTVLAGTTVGEVRALLGEHGQEVTLDPRSDTATVGGTIAAGLSGVRRLRHGPIRDTVLEVRIVDGRATIIKGGGPVVKNVTGYDIPRLFVGSLGTLGAIVQVTLRCRPSAPVRAWYRVERDATGAAALAEALYRPSSVLWDGAGLHVLLEGHAEDLTAQAMAAGLGHADVGEHAPELPDAAHRGRISVPASRAVDVGHALGALDGVHWTAELGVGTIHVACDTAAALGAARAVAERHDGWLLREAGGDGIDGFGTAIPNRALAARVKAAFDPDGRFAPGRIPQ